MKKILFLIFIIGMISCGDDDEFKVDCLPTNLHIAEDIGDLFIGSKYTGKIDDILIYNRELTQSEVTELFELEPCCQ